MSKKKNILMVLESQVDKIILGVIILLSLVLLWLFVIGNPYGEKVRGVSVNPGTIDRKVMDQAEDLLQSLEQPPKADKYSIYDKAFVDEYTQKLQNAIPDVTSDISIPYPGVGEAAIEEDRLYAIPSVPVLTEVDVASMRGTARVPVEEVAPGTPYTSVQTNLEDIDFVTVSGHLDVQRLYDNFNLSFNAPSLKTSWRDTQLAKPVFARIELQRRAKQEDGTYSDWVTVPRTKIDIYKKLLEQLPLHAAEMQFGVDVWVSQYQGDTVQLDILQPEPYLFAYSKMEWMPPEYLHETLEITEKEAAQERREAIEERRKSRETERVGERRPTTTRRPTPMRPGGEEGGGVVALRERQPVRSRTERTVQDVERDMQKVMLKEGGRLDNMREPVLVWVHDDTVQPGHAYEYRLRVGVFNPITGKDWFREDQLAYKDQTVLWSSYSEPTKAVKIPKMLHVFPTDILQSKDGSKEAEGVKVEVAKYYMGQWHSHEFDVYPGQTIGYSVEDTDKDRTQLTEGVVGVADMRGLMLDGTAQSQEIDYTSGMTLVDITKEMSWGARMRRTDFYEMLYYDAGSLMQMGIGKGNWAASLKKAYNDVQGALEESVELREGMTPDRMPEMMPDMMRDML